MKKETAKIVIAEYLKALDALNQSLVEIQSEMTAEEFSHHKRIMGRLIWPTFEDLMTP
jgi:hypothetical protein